MKTRTQAMIAGASGVLLGATTAVLGLGSFAGAVGVAGIAVVAGGAMATAVGVFLHAVSPAPSLLVTTSEEVNESTATLLENVLNSTRDVRHKLEEWRGELPQIKRNMRAQGGAGAASGGDATSGGDAASGRYGGASRPAEVLDQLAGILTRIEGLAQTEAVQERDPSDGDLLMLEGIACRYIPELMDAVDDTFDFLAKFSGGALKDVQNNLETIHSEFGVMSETLEQLEQDVVRGVSHSLEVHSEFLRRRLKASDSPSIIDI
ncbi:hypothetical protein QP868_08465 [Brevibacterium sp. UMB1308A]|uniref:hypothetical protein n=1 Tax=Brevibacterium sp. UMB1308A TaxID=3050608 RepID=UPI00254D1CFF|nr:hypothetical protein [Brevibacterium sp. UMB1308A]MDK8346801.1 hypothetical protein [Brevibacterium sp. UMB1308B]MDK8713930.1 hypothetical protein [Brevibacterium sp. UMB1308A]